MFGGQPVKGSPFKAKATPVPEIEKIKTPVLEELLEQSPCVDQQFEAPVDCSDVPDHRGAILTGKITTPAGKKEKVMFLVHLVLSFLRFFRSSGIISR